jgi:hypothetical protein
LEIGQLAVEILFKQPVFIRSVQKMKIGSVVLPGQSISCNVRIDGNNGSEISFSAIFKCENAKDISRYNGTCVKEEIYGEPKIR